MSSRHCGYVVRASHSTEGDRWHVVTDATLPKRNLARILSGQNLKRSAMNKYGKTASDHWKAVDPQRYEALEGPKEFFSTLGDQVEQRVIDLQTHLAGPDQPDEGYLGKVGRLNMAKLQAEEIAMEELVWLEEAGEPDNDSPTEWDKAKTAAWQADIDDEDAKMSALSDPRMNPNAKPDKDDQQPR